MSDAPDKPQADETGEDDDETTNLESVEIVTAEVEDDGTIVVDDLIAEVDAEGNIVATDELVEIDLPDGTLIVDETFSVADERGELVVIDEDTTVLTPEYDDDATDAPSSASVESNGGTSQSGDGGGT